MNLVLDMGSGNTCRNDLGIVTQMIEAVRDHGPTHGVILKWQLFKDAPPNVPMSPDAFEWAYHVANNCGLKTTASVFDKESLHYLLRYRVPFVKIACNEKYYPLVDMLPASMPAVVSYPWETIDGGGPETREDGGELLPLVCVPEYPANSVDYANHFADWDVGISDHTEGWDMLTDTLGYSTPAIWEKHFCLDDSTGPDAGVFAVRPKDLEYARHHFSRYLSF